MGKTLREVIRETTAKHLDAGHLVMGQCLTAVGWVGGTLPQRQDMTEFPMSDVAQSGFVVGAALVGRRPIYVIRYQGFQHFNSAMIVNYAAKSKAIWGRPCPLLVRSIAMEGKIGPTTGSSHHSLFTRMPGIKVYAPMTPREWRTAYDEWMGGDDPVYLSEHRGSYDCVYELPHIHPARIDFVLAACSITRFAALQAAAKLTMNGVSVAVHHIWRLKPFEPPLELLDDLSNAHHGGIVLDDEHAGGAASAMALQLSNLTGARMRVMGLDDRTAGFADHLDNLPPSAEKIAAYVRELLKREGAL